MLTSTSDQEMRRRNQTPNEISVGRTTPVTPADDLLGRVDTACWSPLINLAGSDSSSNLYEER